MKKFFALVSVLALTACGGGHKPGNDVSQPAEFNDAIRASNSNVTGIITNSKYQIAQYVAYKLNQNSDSTNVSRSAFVPSAATGDKTYDDARELIDLAGWLIDNSTTEQEIIAQFNKDKNKIKNALKLLDDMYCFVGGHADKTAERIISRRSILKPKLEELQKNTELIEWDDITFIMAAASGTHGDEGGGKDTLKLIADDKGKIAAVTHKAFVNNSSGNLVEEKESTVTFKRNNDTDNTFSIYQKNGEGKIFQGTATVATYGKDLGLTYSDFGQLIVDATETDTNGHVEHEQGFEPFAGGRTDVRREQPETAVNFKGKAFGSVSSHNVDKNVFGDATLAFDGTTETLHMDFSKTEKTDTDTPWYDVKIVRNKLADTNYITFTDKGADIPDKLKFSDFNSNNTRTRNNYLVDGYNGEGDNDKTPGHAWGKIDIGYYGPKNGKVTEFTGVTQYVETRNDENGEIRMNIGFGGKKAQ